MLKISRFNPMHESIRIINQNKKCHKELQFPFYSTITAVETYEGICTYVLFLS